MKSFINIWKESYDRNHLHRRFSRRYLPLSDHLVGALEMTDQEAYRLIAEKIEQLRSTYNWGQICIEIKDGKISRINVTIPVRPANHNG